MIHEVFTTPIYENLVVDFDEIQKEIGSALEDLQNKGIFKENLVSDCHMLSDPTFNSNLIDDYDMSAFKNQLKMSLLDYIGHINAEYADPNRFYIQNSWLAWNRPGDYTHLHHHGFSDISGVYYFKTNGEDGDLSLQNPNHVAASSFLYTSYQERLIIKPKVGNLILFPGWLVHNVYKNKTQDDRISLSFNITLTRS